MCFRENQVNLVQQGTGVTLGHQVYLVSMVYLGLLARKVERLVLFVTHLYDYFMVMIITIRVGIVQLVFFFSGGSRFTWNIWKKWSSWTEGVQGEQRSPRCHGNIQYSLIPHLCQ